LKTAKKDLLTAKAAVEDPQVVASDPKDKEAKLPLQLATTK
jgi:hypothetical protein